VETLSAYTIILFRIILIAMISTAMIRKICTNPLAPSPTYSISHVNTKSTSITERIFDIIYSEFKGTDFSLLARIFMGVFIICLADFFVSELFKTLHIIKNG